MSERRPCALPPGRPSADSEFPPSGNDRIKELIDRHRNESSGSQRQERRRRFYVAPTYELLADDRNGLHINIEPRVSVQSVPRELYRLAPDLVDAPAASRSGVTVARGLSCSPGRALALLGFAAMWITKWGFPEGDLVSSDPRQMALNGETFLLANPTLPIPGLAELLRLMTANLIDIPEALVRIAANTFSTGNIE